MKFTVKSLLVVLAAFTSLLEAANGYPRGSTSVEEGQDGCLDVKSLHYIFSRYRGFETPQMKALQRTIIKAAAEKDQVKVKKLMGAYCDMKTEAWSKLTPQQRKAAKKADIE
ncbi:hypothetical protein CDD80_5333 [Ophiocordyceps camponoti-rufipedis]|uniref:Uncharacterized protein n=1 Tax=Ophiocordyceps camponoti-rufipedis TaxID=2004952 RepID=A0A2C5XU90_9HYPO|nr:hypothetical protein CDD80_5333 [Ophiocordyceps camponoti-rufipedis]